MVILYLLGAYGLAYGMSNKFAPSLFRLLKIPKAEWKADIALTDSTTGPVRRFLVRLFACPYCTGFHASWISYLAMQFSQTWFLYIFSGAASCYLLDVLGRRLEK